ncbi:MAG: hypothetical protein LBH49_00520, partial [Puniceicoccales bacterium]|nr:hypothetical protein [Puniceicoccales bacterium]
MAKKKKNNKSNNVPYQSIVVPASSDMLMQPSSAYNGNPLSASPSTNVPASLPITGNILQTQTQGIGSLHSKDINNKITNTDGKSVNANGNQVGTDDEVSGNEGSGNSSNQVGTG